MTFYFVDCKTETFNGATFAHDLRLPMKLTPVQLHGEANRLTLKAMDYARREHGQVFAQGFREKAREARAEASRLLREPPK
jgi:hypothetical protein